MVAKNRIVEMKRNVWIQEDLFVLLYIIRFYAYIEIRKVVQ